MRNGRIFVLRTVEAVSLLHFQNFHFEILLLTLIILYRWQKSFSAFLVQQICEIVCFLQKGVHMRKKWLSVMLSAAMVLGMATPAYAQSDSGSAQELQQETLESGSGDDTGGTEEVNEVAQQDFVNSEDTEVVEEEAPVVYADASSSGKVYFPWRNLHWEEDM